MSNGARFTLSGSLRHAIEVSMLSHNYISVDMIQRELIDSPAILDNVYDYLTGITPHGKVEFVETEMTNKIYDIIFIDSPYHFAYKILDKKDNRFIKALHLGLFYDEKLLFTIIAEIGILSLRFHKISVEFANE